MSNTGISAYFRRRLEPTGAVLTSTDIDGVGDTPRNCAMLFNAHRLKLAVACVGLAASAASAQDARPASDELLVPGLSLSPVGARAIGPKVLPDVDLSAEVLFQILASEVAAQRGA